MVKTITTIGGATSDIMFYTNDMMIIDNKHDLLRQKLIAFEYGAKIFSKDVFFTYGGGGANTAVNLSSLGVKTQVLVSVGNDTVGQEIIQHLKNKKIGTKLVQVNDKLRTGTSFIANVGKYNEHVIFAYRGANDKIDLSTKVIKKIRTKWIYLTSLPDNYQSRLNELFAHCIKKKKKIAWNPGSSQLKWGFKKLRKYIKDTEVFIVNRDEALELVISQKKDKVQNNIKFLFKHLDVGQKLTVITDGHKGAYLYDGDKVYFRAALKKKGINTTGAGDSFGSSLVAGLIKYKWNLEKALKLAILNSNAVIMKIGAQEGILQAKDLKKYKL